MSGVTAPSGPEAPHPLELSEPVLERVALHAEARLEQGPLQLLRGTDRAVLRGVVAVEDETAPFRHEHGNDHPPSPPRPPQQPPQPVVGPPCPSPPRTTSSTPRRTTWAARRMRPRVISPRRAGAARPEAIDRAVGSSEPSVFPGPSSSTRVIASMRIWSVGIPPATTNSSASTPISPEEATGRTSNLK